MSNKVLDLDGLAHLKSKLDETYATAAQGSKADTAYQKPSGGIPSTDMASAVQTSLGKADSAYQKPGTGIPSSDMASAVQTSLGKADSAYQKPGSGIPATDLASGVQTSLGKADSAYQKPSGGIPNSDLAGDIAKSKLASGVQESLGKADTAVQPAELDNYAQKDGTYPGMTSGLALNLKGDEIAVEDGYTDKATAYKAGDENEVADGPVVMSGLKGRAMAWNQLCVNPNCVDGEGGWRSDNTTNTYANNTWNVELQGNANQIGVIKYLSLPANHKIYVRFWMKSSVALTNVVINLQGEAGTASKNFTNASIVGTVDTWNEYSAILYGSFATTFLNILCKKSGMVAGDNVTFAKGCFIDLTLLGCDHLTTAAKVEAWLEARKSLKPYFPYNAGQLLGARMLGWSLRKTANLLNPTTKKARLVPIHYTGHDNEYTVTGWDELTNAALQFTPDNTGVAETVALDANSRFVIPSTGWLEVVASGGDITGDITKVCVKATYDGSRDDEVVAYAEDAHEFDSANIYHKSGDVYSQVFDGGVMRATGDGADAVRDEVGYDNVTKKCYTKKMVGSQLLTNINDWVSASVTGNAYTTASLYDIMAHQSSGNIKANAISSKFEIVPLSANFANYPLMICDRIDTHSLYVRDANCTNLEKFMASIANQYLWYELATPVVYTTDLYYKTGENTYIPLEEVWPINGICNNWATESLTQQEDDANGQPKSITPATIEVFNYDYKEALKTVLDTYVSKEQEKKDVDALLSCVNTNCATAIGGTITTNGYESDGTLKYKFTPNA